MSYLLMPADPRLKALAHEIELERRHALDLSPLAEEDEGEEMDDGPEQRKPGEGFAVLSSAKKAAAPARAEAAPKDLEPERESAYETRERLRGERRRLVASATIEELERGNAMLRRELWR